MVRASSDGSWCSAIKVDVERRAGRATSRAPALYSLNSAMIACASSTKPRISSVGGVARSSGAEESTRATVRLKSARRLPSGSRGQTPVISISFAGFRSVLAGASGAESTVPTALATSTTFSYKTDGATGFAPSRQNDVEQKRWVRARVIAT